MEEQFDIGKQNTSKALPFSGDIYLFRKVFWCSNCLTHLPLNFKEHPSPLKNQKEGKKEEKFLLSLVFEDF